MGPALRRKTKTKRPQQRETTRDAPGGAATDDRDCKAIAKTMSFCHANNLHHPVGHLLSNRQKKSKNNSNVPKQEKFHHSVYVILLDSAVLKHRSVLNLNPNRDPAKPCVYVGMTGLPVEHRFENHKHGYKSAWVVKKYGVRLLPELYAHLNPMPFGAALQMENDLAEDLRAEGYTVTGGK